MLGLGRLRAWNRRRRRRGAFVRRLKASYDAAQTTDHNRRHWAAADSLSANAANSPSVRKTLRERARYEIANSPMATGMVRTLANDLVGTGPRLQVRTDDPGLNREIETQWASWCEAVHLGPRLRTARIAKVTDGEAIALLTTNAGLDHPVKLDPKLIECDRLTTPSIYTAAISDEEQSVDGIVFDADGNPKTYHVLKKHPGASGATGTLQEFDRIPAAGLIHWFTQWRPEQRRGIPDLMSSLPVFAYMRRFVLATLSAAETAAEISLVMKTNAPAGGEAAEVDPWITMDLMRNTGMFAPEGWEPYQLKGEHPAETFSPFRRAMMNEAGRPLNMPVNIATADSADYNYASGRLDHQLYFLSLTVERSEVRTIVLDPLFAAWLVEALRCRELKLLRYADRMTWPHDWHWDGREHVDPLKEALAATRLYTAGLLTAADYFARRGQDWETVYAQLKLEREKRAELKLPDPWVKQGAQNAQAQ